MTIGSGKINRLSTFTVFPELPPEIRQIIWEFSLPNRTFEVGPVRPLNPPSIAAVCSEARDVAKKHWTICTVNEYHYGTGPSRCAETCFFPSRDVLFINPLASIGRLHGHHPLWHQPHANISCFGPHLETICLPMHSVSGPMSLSFDAMPAIATADMIQWPKLKKYLFYDAVLQMAWKKGSQLPAGVEPKHNELAIIPATDTDTLKKMYEACDFELSPGRQYRHQVEAQFKAMTEPGFFDSVWSKQLRLLQKSWVRSNWRNLPSRECTHDKLAQSEDGSGEYTHPWAQEILESLPDFKQVVVFRLHDPNETSNQPQWTAI